MDGGRAREGMRRREVEGGSREDEREGESGVQAFFENMVVRSGHRVTARRQGPSWEAPWERGRGQIV